MKKFIAVIDVHHIPRGRVRVQHTFEARNWQSSRNKAEKYVRSREFSQREHATVMLVEEMKEK